MPKSWNSLAETSGMYEVSDFQKAAYQLMCSQILYESNAQQRLAYKLIAQYETQFREALGLFGMDLVTDDLYRYCAAIPRVQPRVALPLEETLLVLVLRKLYHEHANKGSLTDEGHAVVSIEELQAAFKAATKKELPTTRRELESLIDQMKRFGFARETKDPSASDQPFDIAILPGIARVVNEDTLMKLSSHYESAATLIKVRQSKATTAAQPPQSGGTTGETP